MNDFDLGINWKSPVFLSVIILPSMENFVSHHLCFFDSITLFVDYWRKNSDLELDFVFSCFRGETKAVIKFHRQNEDHLAVFKQHLLRHFDINQASDKIIFSGETVEIFMKNGVSQEPLESTAPRVPKREQASSYIQHG